jgi:hypothetical protein
MRIASEAADFEIEVSRVERVTERRRLAPVLLAEHAQVPRFTGELVGFLAGSGGAFRRRTDRTAVDAFT